ncbi:Hamartin-domain-containing protein [Ascodesmis nigricans]|uniref:Hamartin-domain-containing protein n=1 Tax=Ascodesmis nigricans TaxID=341454 RepID=A0A4S2N886_9PEZI|nr:Hamartin-domain-containing protein [Ascodesmis nigricans]
MSGGTVKELIRLLNAALSSSQPQYPLSDELTAGIHAYIDRHLHIDENEAEHLQEELLKIFETKVQGNTDKFAVFLGCIRTLRPVIISKDKLLKWWEVLVRPTFDSMGQAKAVIADARAIVLSVMAYDEDDDPTGEREAASNVFTDKLLDIYLDTTRATTVKNGGINAEQTYRFVSQNVEAVLLAYGKRRPQAFLEKIDYYVTHKECRLQILGLLCSYVQLQGPHLYYILRTPLFDHLLQCLENDTSTTVISLALTILIMFMPHLCNSLGPYLPRLFVIYTRVLCWDKFGVVRLDVHSSLSNYSRAASPLSMQDSDSATQGGASSSGWDKLDSSFETATSTTPDVSDYFSFLYGLYPINFLAFIREPYKFLDRSNYKEIDQLDIDEETVRARTAPYRQRHILHPNFLTLTAETELSDQNRWMKVEPADVTAQCIGLVVNNMPAISAPRRRPPIHTVSSSIPDSLIPDEDIPAASLLDTDPETAEAENQQQAGSDEPKTHQRSTVSPRDSRYHDSPTIPASLGTTEQQHLQNMLDLQEQLHAGLYFSKNGNTPTPPLHSSLPHPSGPPPTYPGSAAASPHLGAYAHTLAHDLIPRSPALRPARSDIEGTIAYLQREVMLLKNDLNFERYLKQQHLSHIGHLQRKHIKDSSAEAETQNLINTNRNLKAKLEVAKEAYQTLREESTKMRSQSKKWEAELSAKIRTLRDEQKAWRAEEQATKSGLETARIEADNLRKLLAESEADGLRLRQKLKTLESKMEEVNKLKTSVDRLSRKASEYQAKAEECEKKKLEAESMATMVDELNLRLKTRDTEVIEMRRGYESRIREMESCLNSLPQPLPASPSPKFQGMLDDVLAATNSKLSTLKKAHNHLLRKYTDLEIKHMELQSQYEALVGGDMQRQFSSDNEGVGLGVRRHPIHYQSEDGMSPGGSYAESVSSYQYGPLSADSTSHYSAPEFPFPRAATSNYMRVGNSNLKSSSSFHGFSTGTSGLATSSPPETIHGDDRAQQNDETRSVRTVTSTTSSERRRAEKVKPQSEVRIRGRGGAQNIGKKIKDKDGDETPPKQKKKSRFAAGSGLAGIRSFV